MILLDVNILLHLHNESSPSHRPINLWLNQAIEIGEWLGIPPQVLWSFLRIATNPRIFSNPMTGQEAMDAVTALLTAQRVRLIHPGPRHFELLSRFIAAENAIGNLVPDAVLAALAQEFGATVASTDDDFRRFDVPWINPSKAI